jgi:prefoldin beta subunit
LQFVSHPVRMPADQEPQEFERLQEGEGIYKLVGPVLLKQDKVEAESTVKGRLEFISKEL